jgi:hypothetical protein
MRVLTRFDGVVIRMMIDRILGMRLHAFYRDSELVIGLNPLRVIQGDVPAWVQERALAWARQHQEELPSAAGPRNSGALASWFGLPVEGSTVPLAMAGRWADSGAREPACPCPAHW